MVAIGMMITVVAFFSTIYFQGYTSYAWLKISLGYSLLLLIGIAYIGSVVILFKIWRREKNIWALLVSIVLIMGFVVIYIIHKMENWNEFPIL